MCEVILSGACFKGFPLCTERLAVVAMIGTPSQSWKYGVRVRTAEPELCRRIVKLHFGDI